jgi:lipopolysaccharide biosynthesis protein
MNFTVLEKEQFEKLEKYILEIRELLTKKPEQDLSDSLIESKDVPKLLGISQKTWQTYRDNGTIPFTQYGSKIWVKRKDIEDFLNKYYITKNK